MANLYMQIKTHAEGKGPVCMVALTQRVLHIQCFSDEPLTLTAKHICNIVNCIFMIKSLDEDLFKCVVLLNSLGNPQYLAVQSQVS